LTHENASFNILNALERYIPENKGVFQMFGLGPTELIIILIIALVIFGPSRLPKVGQSVGQALRAFRESTDKVQEEVSKSLEAGTTPTEERKE